MDSPIVAIIAALLGGIELRWAVHRMLKKQHAMAIDVKGLEKRIAAVETPKPDSWKYPTIGARGAAGAGLLLACMLLGGCFARTSTSDAIATLRRDTIAEAAAPTPQGRALAAAAVKADIAALPVVERVTERHALLRDAVAAVAVVALCIEGASAFPMLALLLRSLAGAAGIFAGFCFALRSLLSVPEWLMLSILGAIASIAVLAMLRHGKRASATLHETVALARGEVATVSRKAAVFAGKVRDWRNHHFPTNIAPAAPTAQQTIPGV